MAKKRTKGQTMIYKTLHRKLLSTGRQVAPYGHIILIPSQAVFAFAL
jgi:hypothetical protein